MIDQGFHHDGSADHVSTLTPELGENVTVFLRGPRRTRGSVHLRTVVDGEPYFTEAVPDRESGHETWWRADLIARHPITRYRFLLTGEHGYGWLTQAGLREHDVPDSTDFRLVTHQAPPSWSADAIIYQIFPDRFARSSRPAALPEWAIGCRWDDPVEGKGSARSRQFFGGDLDGIRTRLYHLDELGVNTIYLTPMFPAPSNHRYNASSFQEIDPMLGGDRAGRALIDEVHARGWRILGDLTTNHCGDGHPWFRAALRGGPEREMFTFTADEPGYEAWMSVRSLPKLDWSSELVRRAMVVDGDSVVRRWLRFGLDGWRIDSANMTGRLRAADRTHEVARLIRRVAVQENPEALLIAEHAHDATGDLDADGWHGTTSYAGFTRPVWSWLRGPEARLSLLGVPGEVPRMPGETVLATMRNYAAQLSWRAQVHSWSVLGSHDTARIRTVCGSPELVEVAAGLLFTLPGLPMVFAGDEIGLEGGGGGDARRTIPWSAPERWDARTLDAYRRLIALRRNQAALRHGSLRWLHANADALTFARERAGEGLLIHAARAHHQPVRLALAAHAVSLYGDGPDLVPALDGTVMLPGDGPRLHVWRLA